MFLLVDHSCFLPIGIKFEFEQTELNRTVCEHDNNFSQTLTANYDINFGNWWLPLVAEYLQTAQLG